MSSPSSFHPVRVDRLSAFAELLRSGLYAQLEERALRELAQGADDGEVWKYLARALRMQGKNDLDVWRRVVALQPDDPEALYNLGDALRASGKAGEAEASYRRVLAINPGVFGAYLNLGLIHQNSGRLDEAEADYLQAQRLKPDLPEASFNLGQLYKQQGRFDEARGQLRQAIGLRPAFAEAHNAIGIVLRASGQAADAEAAFNQALRLRSNFLGPLINLRELFASQGRTSEAESVCRRVLEIRPDLNEIRVELGALLYGSGRIGEAEEVFREVLCINADCAEAHGWLGLMLLRMGRHGESDIALRRAFELRADYPELHRRVGQLLYRLDRFDDAIRHAEAALKGAGSWKDRLLRLSDPWIVLESPGSASSLPLPRVPDAVAAVSVPAPARADHPSMAGGGRRLRVVLIYPPPWHILPPGDRTCGMPYGPPREEADRELDHDFSTIPYGVLTIAAEARRAGHKVQVFNLSTLLWSEVESLIARTGADVFGISAFTANRRGMGAVAGLIRRLHPEAHITAGGPFVTALPRETLHYYRDIDSVVIGEGEGTFMELLDRISAGQPTNGIPGSAWRSGEHIVLGPARPRIRNLDDLASPFDYFSSHIVMTSRGCPSRCSFCGSFASWGRKLRFHSVDVCVDNFRKALAHLPVPFLVVKDDTFTAHRKRALAICDRIIESRMNFFWSCDTRADSLDEELIRKMRLAGCQRISLGVESGSPQILDTIHKETSPETVLEITRLARKYGIHVRYYMIVGNRGETPETVQQSIDLARAGRPGYMMFYSLSFFPGTEEWEWVQKTRGVTPDIFFTRDFRELGISNYRKDEWGCLLAQIQCEIGAYGYEFTVEERTSVVELMPNLPSAHVDLANACLKSGRLSDASRALDRAEALGYPVQGLIDNQRACIALASGDAEAALVALDRALECLDHSLIRVNRQNLVYWMNAPKTVRGDPPRLNDASEPGCFQILDQSDITAVGVEPIGS